ncbi:MAG: hypothetical protein WC505_00955 [Patescibacteria group bacterium]
MSEEELKQLLNTNIELTRSVYESLERQRKVRLWTLILGIAVIVLPLIAAAFAVPWMISTIESYYGGALNY